MAVWKKTFVCMFIAQLFSIMGFSFALPFLPFFIEDLGVKGGAEQAWWSGVVMSATGVTLALFAPLWGSLADRYGRKAMVIRAMFGGTLVLILMSYVQSVGQLIVCRLLQGALTGTVGASVAMVASVSPPQRSGFTLGMMQAAVFLGVSLGPLMGGMVSDHMGYRAAFRLGALIVFLGAVLVWRGTREDYTPPSVEERRRQGGYRQILVSSGFLAAVFVLFSIRFSNTLSNPSFPLIVKEILGSAQQLNSVTGFIMCASALAGAVAAGLLGHFGDRLGHKRVLLMCSLSAAVVSVAHFFAHSIAYLVVVRILFGFAVAGMIPAANIIIRQSTGDGNIGKAYGVATSISMAGFAFGPFLGGAVGRVAGLRAPFLLTGVGQLIVVVVVLVFVREQMLHTPDDMPCSLQGARGSE